MSGNHPDANPVSMMNPYEDSLHDPEQEVVQIAPAESNFLTLKSDSATNTNWTFNFTSSSPTTLYTNKFQIVWEATITLPSNASFPPMFAPVANPLAKICKSFRMTLNGKTVTCEPWIEAKVEEYETQSSYHDQARKTEPRQFVRGASIGDIPVCGAPHDMMGTRFNNGAKDNEPFWTQPDYYFGGKMTAQQDQTIPWADYVTKGADGQLPVNVPQVGSNQSSTMFNPTRYFTDNQMTPYASYIEGSNRVVRYRFISPLPHDLFMDRDKQALVNLSEVQIQLQFHTNIIGRMFAWRGDFYDSKFGDRIDATQITCDIFDNTSTSYPLLMYQAITSANESSIPSSLTVSYREHRIQRERYQEPLVPSASYQTAGDMDLEPGKGGAKIVDQDTVQIHMKPVRLSNIPNKIRLFACPDESSFDNIKQIASNKRAGNTSYMTLEQLDAAQPGSARLWETNSSTSAITLLAAGVALFKNCGAYHWFAKWHDDSGIHYPLPYTVTNLLSFSHMPCFIGDPTAVFGAFTQSEMDGTAEITAEQAARLKLLKVVPVSDVAQPGNGSQGWGNEIPTLKITDVRITLNNKTNLLMSPEQDSDLFYWNMCHKNGLMVDFEDFRKGGPILIDVGTDLGARGLVTGASGMFECQISFKVSNYIRENGIMDFARTLRCRERYGSHPIKALSSMGFYAYAMFEYPVSLTIEPGMAEISVGIPLDEIAKATSQIIPISEQSGTASAGGALNVGKMFSRIDKKMHLRRAWRKVKHAASKASDIVDNAQDALQQAERAHSLVKGALAGSGGNMYG